MEMKDKGMSMQSHSDIKIVEANPYEDGNDYIIGDVHGNADCLIKVLAKLTSHDRLFIAGDLTDRGKKNQEVLALCQHPDYQDRIFIVRGNHEDMCLQSISMFEKYRNELVRKSGTEEVPHILFEAHLGFLGHIKGGGGWLETLFLQALNLQGNTVMPDEAGEKMIEEIKNFMGSLSYLILVKGNETKKPFVVVHARNILSNSELLERIETSKPFSSTEKKAMTWDRIENLLPQEMMDYVIEDVMATYCGHSIVVNQTIPSPVRPAENAINLDVGGYKNNVLLMLNHTQSSAEYVSGEEKNPFFEKKKEIFESVLNSVNRYLQFRKQSHLSVTVNFSSSSLGLFAFPEDKERPELTINEDGMRKTCVV